MAFRNQHDRSDIRADTEATAGACHFSLAAQFLD